MHMGMYLCVYAVEAKSWYWMSSSITLSFETLASLTEHGVHHLSKADWRTSTRDLTSPSAEITVHTPALPFT